MRKTLAATVAVLAGLGVARAEPVPGGPPAGASEGALCELHLTDGSRFVGRVALPEVALQMVYGTLRIPGTDVEEIRVGIHVDAETAARVTGLVAQLGDADFRRREEAARGLEGLGRSALPALEEAQGSEDAEVAARVREILGRLRQQLGDVRREEEVYTARCGRLRGRMELLPIRIRLDVGELTIPAGRIDRMIFDRTGGRFVEGFEDGIERWTETHSTRSQWHVAADAADGRAGLRFTIPGEANYDDGAQARIVGPRIMVSHHRRGIVRFQYKLFIEQGADHCWMKILTESGQELSTHEMGPAAAWTPVEVPIPPGTREIRVAFEFRTDGSVQATGASIDQVEVFDREAVVPPGGG